MYTRWYSPQIVEELASDEISYSGSILGSVNTEYTSLAPVTSVARSQGGVLQTGVRSLVFRDFGITESGEVRAVELFVFVNRLARVQDRTVQLWQSGPLGRNRADLAAEDQWYYGSDITTFWQVKTPLTVNSENFGVLIDLQPHSQYPSRDSVYLREVKIRIDFH